MAKVEVEGWCIFDEKENRVREIDTDKFYEQGEYIQGKHGQYKTTRFTVKPCKITVDVE